MPDCLWHGRCHGKRFARYIIVFHFSGLPGRTGDRGRTVASRKVEKRDVPTLGLDDNRLPFSDPARGISGR